MIAGSVLADGGDRGRDRGMAVEYRFDLAQLDPEATELDLPIDPAEEFERAATTPAHQVASAIEPALAKGILNELLRAQLGPIVIATRDAIAPDVELPRYPNRDRLAVLVEHVQRCIGDRPAQLWRPVIRTEREHRGPHRRLGRPVHVPKRVSPRQQLLGEHVWQCLAAADDLQRVAAFPASVDQHLPGGGSGLHERGLRPREPVGQVDAVESRLARHDHEPSAGRQRQVPVRNRKIECRRGQAGQHIVRGKSRSLPHVGDEVGDRAMCDLDALRLPGRAGRVDDVCELFRIDLDPERLVTLLGEHCPVTVEAQDLRTAGIDHAHVSLLCQQHRRLRVGQHELLTLGRIGRLDRHVRRAGFEHAEHCNEQIHRAVEADPDKRPRLHAQTSEPAGKLIRATVELAVRDPHVAGDDGDRLRRALRLLGEQLV